MKIGFNTLLLSGFLTMGFAACGNKATQTLQAQQTLSEDSVIHSANVGNVQVDQEKLVSKGVIKSVTDIVLYAELQKKVVECNLSEGKLVQKGQVLLRLDDEEIRMDIEKARHEFEQAQYHYMEILVGQGYKSNELSQVPQNVKEQAMIKSNYQSVELNLEIAKKQLEKTLVKAPCSGAITKVKIHKFDMPGMEPFCHIIDPGNLMVEFNVLETELQKIQKGSIVSVTSVTYPNEPHEAVVTNVSIMVDEDGMLKVEALLKQATHLLPGMTAIVNF